MTLLDASTRKQIGVLSGHAEIVRTVARDAREGDLVIVMSNGGFDGIHQKLLSALEARA